MSPPQLIDPISKLSIPGLVQETYEKLQSIYGANGTGVQSCTLKNQLLYLVFGSTGHFWEEYIFDVSGKVLGRNTRNDMAKGIIDFDLREASCEQIIPEQTSTASSSNTTTWKIPTPESTITDTEIYPNNKISWEQTVLLARQCEVARISLSNKGGRQGFPDHVQISDAAKDLIT